MRHIDSCGTLKPTAEGMHLLHKHLSSIHVQTIYHCTNFPPCQASSIPSCVAKNNRKCFVVVCFHQILRICSILWSHLEVEICHYSSGAVQMLRKMTNENHAFSLRLVLQLIAPTAIMLTGFSVVPDEEHVACQHAAKLTWRTRGDF